MSDLSGILSALGAADEQQAMEKIRELQIAAAKDDPDYDASDLAHPAWWRGNDRGVEATVEIVNRILDGERTGKFGAASLNALKDRLNSVLPVTAESHPDDLAVDRFATAMKLKLKKKRSDGYQGWDGDDPRISHVLAYRLIEHIPKGDPVDIGNFAMMLHQRGVDPALLSDAADRWAMLLPSDAGTTAAMVDRACRSRYSAFDDWSEELKADERYKMQAALAAALQGDGDPATGVTQ